MTEEQALKLRTGDLCTVTYEHCSVASHGSTIRFISHEPDDCHVWELIDGHSSFTSSVPSATVQPVKAINPNRCFYLHHDLVEPKIMPNIMEVN